MQRQLKPLCDLVDELSADAAKTKSIPDFKSLAEWHHMRSREADRANRSIVGVTLDTPREFDTDSHALSEPRPGGEALQVVSSGCTL